ncbi:NAD(P)/FAD-dependent oxidoreductase [Streptomyces flavofungini]|uniref:FAD-dependent oxidoreductase n=1 Tax=Streptomyces flavofungini TaxID=68200 RepID=A0ABS0XF25_9ACTN|nr:FAD-dependent oxidoreductase [Streptomyces flavofungini]MBJ3811577.1 FAD-dependent oxidoreductase [Streptomyces flavofungini]MBJ3811785.1 FAD-dependent oxidoreductase [Streptomyces flavofungini]GHC85992.1 pyridine nucleotide-disulfide oxidoreductase [Streptomyces flavofungini]
MNTVTVVGASLAGLYAARELRAQGFDGRLVLVGAEPHLPYDRPPLSKAFLTDTDRAASTPTVTDSAGASATGTGASPDREHSPATRTSPTTGTAPGTGIHAPYESAPESQLALTDPELALTDPEEITDLAAEWLLGVHATGLDQHGRAVLLDDGRTVVTDGVVIATGASARRLPGPQPAGVHTLRTLADARALRADLTRGPRRVVVIGGGFIGAETASSCVALGHDVTVVEAAPLPLIPQLGPDMAMFCADLHRQGGARLLTGTGVAGLHRMAPAYPSGDAYSSGDAAQPGGTDPSGATDRPGATALGSSRTRSSRTESRGPANPGHVTAVELSDGRILPADVVVVGIGATPNTGWLSGTSLAVGDGVLCDAGCVASLPQVVAVGDVARVGGVRAEHWTSATEQPRVAVRNLLAAQTVETVTALPYFWSDQYGSRIQFAGHRPADATVRITEGSPDDGGFLALYEHAGRVAAALAVNCPRPFMRTRRELRAQRTATV